MPPLSRRLFAVASLAALLSVVAGIPTVPGIAGVPGVPAVLGAAPARADEPLKMWAPPPREKPQFTKSAEGFPPLPLPVVPQRRSEKKRPPAPPMLIANLTNFSTPGWLGSPGSVDTLLNDARKGLDAWYGWEMLDLRQLTRQFQAGVEYHTPIIYLCAYYPLKLSADQRQALQAYVLGGGMLLINCCGQDKAYASAKEELAAMFPKRELRPLPMDHPIYNCYHKVAGVTYPKPSDNPMDAGAADAGPPRLEAVTLGARAAAVVSLEDLASGWAQWNPAGVRRVSPHDSVKLGFNLVTYAAAELRLAKFQSKTQEIAGPSVRPREQLVFAQLVHDGNWNPNPSGVPLFLKELASTTSVAVSFERRQVELKDPTLFTLPLLYMTGQWDPRFSKDEAAVLHRYLANGGVLIADAASGRQEFDRAFRVLCKTLFPDNPLKPLPPEHPLFSSFYKIDTLAAHHEPKPIAPIIEAIIINDRPVVLYSPLGLSDGWAYQFSSYARCYATPDAIKLGTNLVVYAMQ